MTVRYETARNYTTAETAKIIRQALKKAFPSTTFSVRSKSYSGGSSIRIHWVDGPTTKQIEAITARYEGKGFDGMIDLAYHIDAWVLNGEIIGTRSRGTGGSRGSVPAWGLIPPHDDAELISFSSSYVFTDRDISAAFANRYIKQVAAYWGGVAEPLPVAVDTKYGFDIAGGRGNERVRPDLSHMDDWYSMIRRCASDPSQFVTWSCVECGDECAERTIYCPRHQPTNV